MTRGKIILIQGDTQVYITCEFNGDMHPNMHGEEIVECFKDGLFQNYRDYERFVENFNRKIYYQLIDKIVVREPEANFKSKSILSEQEFAEIIDRLREASDLQEQVDRLFRNSRENIENDFCNAAALQISHESLVVFLLKRIMHDQYEYIDYFIYELDYGRKYEPGMITDESGQDIDIHTSKLLYDFISNNGVICQKEE